MARATKVLAVIALMVGMSAVQLTSATADPATAVVPYGAGGYRYLQVAPGGGDATFDDIDFDDSAFGSGVAPFGQAAPEFDCGLTPSTAWSPTTDLLVRRTVVLPAGTTNVVIHAAVDNDLELFWNGSPLGEFEHDGCAARDSVEMTVPNDLLAEGDNVLAARASDDGGETFLDLEVTANLPPDCASVSMDKTTLWPPSHDLRVVTAVGGTDPEGQPVSLAIAEVTQDEPLDSVGDGSTVPDAERSGLPADQVRLRAERSGTGDGRVYRVVVQATDPGGASCSTTMSVGVPHDMGKGREAIDTTDVVVDSFGADPSLVVPGVTAVDLAADLPVEGGGTIGEVDAVVPASTPTVESPTVDAPPPREVDPPPAPVVPSSIPAPVEPQAEPPSEVPVPTTPPADEKPRGKSAVSHEPRGASNRSDRGPR